MFSLGDRSPSNTSFFDEINRGVVLLPDDLHLHTVVCPSTGTSALPNMERPEAAPFYSWVKTAIAAMPVALAAPSINTSIQPNDSPKGQTVNEEISMPTCAHLKNESPKHHTTPVIATLDRQSQPSAAANTAAAQALGCSAVLIRIYSFVDGAKEPRVLVFQVHDAQLRSCRILPNKKRGNSRVISEAFLFPTLEESVDVHVSLMAPLFSPGAWEESSSSSSIQLSLKSSAGSSFGKAKAILDSVLLKSSFSNISAKGLMFKGRKGSPIFDSASGSSSPASPILNSRRREEPIIASTIFRINLISAANSALPQWFELMLPMTGSSGVAKLVLSVSTLYAPTPSKSKWRSRPTSLLSLINLQNENGAPAHADYLTLLQKNSSPTKVPTWRRFWAVVTAGRILLYPYQQKEAVLPLLTIELANIISVKPADPERLHQRYAFHLISDNGIRHSLYADSAASLKKWMKTFATGHSSEVTTNFPLLFNNIKTPPILSV